MDILEEFKEHVSSLGEEVRGLNKVGEVYKKIASLAADCESIKKELSESSKTLMKAQAQLEKQSKEMEKFISDNTLLMETGIETLKDENKRQYNDLSNAVQTRLDNNKMEIKQLIDLDSQSTKSQIKDIHSELTKLSQSVETSRNQLQMIFINKFANIQKLILGLCIPTIISLMALIVIVLIS